MKRNKLQFTLFLWINFGVDVDRKRMDGNVDDDDGDDERARRAGRQAKIWKRKCLVVRSDRIAPPQSAQTHSRRFTRKGRRHRNNNTTNNNKTHTHGQTKEKKTAITHTFYRIFFVCSVVIASCIFLFLFPVLFFFISFFFVGCFLSSSCFLQRGLEKTFLRCVYLWKGSCMLIHIAFAVADGKGSRPMR